MYQEEIKAISESLLKDNFHYDKLLKQNHQS